MKIEDFLKTNKNLLFSVVCFISGIAELLSKEDKHSLGWFMLLTSLGWLANFFVDRSKSERPKKVFNILSYIILASMLICIVADKFLK